MINESIRISIMTRLYCKSFGIAGEDLLGIDMVTDEASPYFGRVPIPPILDAQIDEIWRTNMTKRKKKMLSMLKSRILNSKLHEWFETFLTIFIILNNLEWSYRQKCSQLQRHMDAVSYSNYDIISSQTTQY
jgi:hypothetical protein